MGGGKFRATDGTVIDIIKRRRGGGGRDREIFRKGGGGVRVCEENEVLGER